MMGLVGAALAGVMLFAANPGGNLEDTTALADVLTTHVKDSKVDYASLQKDRAKLDAFLQTVAAVPKADFEKATKDQKIAYLTNAYNAYTLKVILDAYPIKKAGGFGSLLNTAPSNSIKQIPGAWDKKKHKTALGDLTLDQIEHENLRKHYDTPLVHMALVCASKGCPPLRGEPYLAEKLNEQLEDQARIYLASPYGLVVEGNTVKVSAIFKWFGKDFDKQYGGPKGFVEKFAPEAKAAAVKKAAGSYSYIDYDWSLNEQKKSS